LTKNGYTFTKADPFEPTYRHRVASAHQCQVLDRIDGTVYYDTGCSVGMFGVESEEQFETNWEPLHEGPVGILELFGD